MNLVALWAVRPTLARLLATEQALAGAGLLAGVTLSICFVCGVTVARLALRRAVKEPAVASVLALIALSLLQLRLGMVNLAGPILGAPLCFGAAYLGGRLGWRWRKRRMQRVLGTQASAKNR
jgi:hypothetical protein